MYYKANVMHEVTNSAVKKIANSIREELDSAICENAMVGLDCAILSEEQFPDVANLKVLQKVVQELESDGYIVEKTNTLPIECTVAW